MSKLTGLILLLIAAPLAAETITYRVLVGGDDVGHMIVDSDGVVYYPTEIYPWFGIRPFSEAPTVMLPDEASSD